MKILFLTDLVGNSGSVNANRKIVDNWPQCDTVVLLSSVNPLIGLFESIVKGLYSDVVISLGTRWFEMIAHRILNCFGTPFICFNHGYVPFENKINNLGYSQIKIDEIRHHMSTADLVIANSRLQSRFIVSQQPDLAKKTTWSTLGVDPFEITQRAASDRKCHVIAVSGGMRYVKGNDVVIRAISKLREKGICCRLEVYGKEDNVDNRTNSLKYDSDVIYCGQISHDLFLRSLRNVDLLVMNSRHESFGLSAIDALSQGCSLLISANCGVGEVMKLEDSDVINDCENVNEVADKIERILKDPNATRLIDSIDFQKSSWTECSKRIREMCRMLTEDSSIQ